MYVNKEIANKCILIKCTLMRDQLKCVKILYYRYIAIKYKSYRPV